MPGTPVYVAAGSNVAPLRVSGAYANPAIGFVGEDFVNLVVGFETGLPLEAVIERLHEAEAACGRVRDAPKWGPRSMDLDLLLFGDAVLTRPGFTLPRPDLLRRPYMLGPAAEIAPHFVHPTERRTLAELWRELQRCDPHELRPVALDPGSR